MAVKKETPRRKMPVRKDLLSKDDRETLDSEAQKSVAAELAQDARDAYFAEALAKARRAHVPSDELLNVTIDVAPYVPFIMLDGVQFFHGYTYQVANRVRMVLMEQMQRSWLHQDEIDGRSRFNLYRRPQNVTIGPHNQGQPTVGANGLVQAEV